jgi:anhydro-N-acetylmuramic acid kinase
MIICDYSNRLRTNRIAWQAKGKTNMGKNPIERLCRKKKMRIAGLMSGTSTDGVDAAIIDFDGENISVLAFDTFEYPPSLRKSIFRLFESQSCLLADICHLNFVIGEVFADAVLKLCRKSKINLSTIDLIGSHGQTVFHNPKGTKFDKKIIRSTLQIGEPSVIAYRTGKTVVADFRPLDLAAGGEGAPLVPFTDYILFSDKKLNRAVQNVGGIANVTFLPANSKLKDVVAFDTGPGNMIIDRIVSLVTKGRKKFDRDGDIAKKGKIDSAILNNLLSHPYFDLKPPKSTGREMFGRDFSDNFYKRAVKKGLAPEDIVATAAAFTVESIYNSYCRFLPALPDEIILCGGGSRNKTLVKLLQQQFGKVKILLSDQLGINCDAKEAISFAILAYATIKGIANNVPSATGAKQALVLGKIVQAK